MKLTFEGNSIAPLSTEDCYRQTNPAHVKYVQMDHISRQRTSVKYVSGLILQEWKRRCEKNTEVSRGNYMIGSKKAELKEWLSNEMSEYRKEEVIKGENEQVFEYK